jgi:hypothetical protein
LGVKAMNPVPSPSAFSMRTTLARVSAYTRVAQPGSHEPCSAVGAGVGPTRVARVESGVPVGVAAGVGACRGAAGSAGVGFNALACGAAAALPERQRPRDAPSKDAEFVRPFLRLTAPVTPPTLIDLGRTVACAIRAHALVDSILPRRPTTYLPLAALAALGPADPHCIPMRPVFRPLLVTLAALAVWLVAWPAAAAAPICDDRGASALPGPHARHA